LPVSVLLGLIGLLAPRSVEIRVAAPNELLASPTNSPSRFLDRLMA